MRHTTAQPSPSLAAGHHGCGDILNAVTSGRLPGRACTSALLPRWPLVAGAAGLP